MAYASIHVQDKPASAYQRYGERWTDEERASLRKLFSLKCSLGSICDKMQRPRAGVLAKLSEMRLINLEGSLYHKTVETTRNLTSIDDAIDESITTPEEITMSTSTPFAVSNKTFIFGEDVTTMSDYSIIGSIRKLEERIGTLESIKTPSKKITAMIEALNEDKAKIVALLDERV